MKIFLLEDDYILNQSIKESLELESYIVDSFYDGKEALDNILYSYDLYILDINVPFIEGTQILEYIKENNINSKVLMISSILDINKIKESYKKGCYDCDAITIVPYLCTNSSKEFYDVAVLNNKMVFQIIKTQNPSSAELQDLVVKGEPIYSIIANQIFQDTNYLKKYETVGAAIGTSDVNELKAIRRILKDRILLISRYGFQGAGLDKIKFAFNEDSLGVIVNSSSKIMYAHQTLKVEVSEGAYIAAKKMKEELNQLR